MMDKSEWFNGDEWALLLYDAVVEIAHTWDDLVDKDREVSPEAIHSMLTKALVGLPLNPFFVRHSATLYPFIVTAIVSYIASTKLEKEKDLHKMELAHFLRYAIYLLPVMSSVLTGGISHAVNVLTDGATTMIPERYPDFLEEHRHAVRH